MDPTFIALISVSSMAMVAVIIWLAQREKQAKIDSQRDVQLALLGKFSSGEEMSQFLASEEGRRFVNQLSGPNREDPRRMTVGLLVGGVVLLALGGGFCVMSIRIDRMMVPGIFFLALSIGLLMASGIAQVVSKKLGLISGGSENSKSGS